jgi:hypothetical protein
MRTAIHLVMRACLVTSLLAVPGGAALALAIVDSSLTITNLTITPASGSASFELPLDTSAATNSFNSLGESVSNGNTGVGTPVSASAAVTFAQGTAQASPSPGSVGASASVNIPSGTVLAGVTLPGSIADLSGNFIITGSATALVNVTFSMQVSGSLSGVSDALGFLQTGDLTAELDIDGTPVLFDYEALPGLPSVAGINNLPNTTIPISETLTATTLLDTFPHFFDMHADAEVQAFNTVPAPLIGRGLPVFLAVGGILFGASLSRGLGWLLAEMGALTWSRRGGAMERTGPTMTLMNSERYPSFPRTRESRAQSPHRLPWALAFARVTHRYCG